MPRPVAVAVVLLLAALVFNPASAKAATPPVSSTFFGMHDPQEDAAVPYGAVRLWDVHTTWADLEPSRGRYDFAHLDAMVAKAWARGARVTLVLGATPAWAAKDPTLPSARWLGPGSSSPPADAADWTSFVGTVAAYYKGRIDSYQIWNEGSLWQFWQGTPAELAALTHSAYATIKSIDSKALVVSTPMLPRQPTWSTWSVAYLTALRSLGWPVDVFAIHSYQPDALASPEGRSRGIRKMQTVLKSVGAPVKPMWDTEANYTSNAFGRYKITGRQAADWVARAYLDSLRYGISRTFWYAYNARVGHLGVTMTPGTAASRGFTAISAWLVGRAWKGCATVPVKKSVVKKVRVHGRLVTKTVRVKTGVKVTTCTFTSPGKKKSWVTWATPDPKAVASAARKAVKGQAPKQVTARAAMPVKTRNVCRLLTGCRTTTKKTMVTTSPVLLR